MGRERDAAEDQLRSGDTGKLTQISEGAEHTEQSSRTLGTSLSTPRSPAWTPEELGWSLRISEWRGLEQARTPSGWGRKSMDMKAGEPESKELELFAEIHERCCPSVDRLSSFSGLARPADEEKCRSAKSCMSATDSAIVGTSLCMSEGRPLCVEARYLCE